MTRTEVVKNHLAQHGHIDYFGKQAMAFHLIWAWRCVVAASGVSRLLGLSNFHIAFVIVSTVILSGIVTTQLLHYWGYALYYERIHSTEKFDRDGIEAFRIASGVD